MQVVTAGSLLLFRLRPADEGDPGEEPVSATDRLAGDETPTAASEMRATSGGAGASC